jgi:hypothetical protein
MENRYKNGFQTQEPSWSWFFFVRENHVITGWCPPFCYVNVGLDELPMNTIVRYIYHKPELNHLYIYISLLKAILGAPSCSFPNQSLDKWLLAVGYTLINSLLVAPHNINGHFRNQLIGGTSHFSTAYLVRF